MTYGEPIDTEWGPVIRDSYELASGSHKIELDVYRPVSEDRTPDGQAEPGLEKIAYEPGICEIGTRALAQVCILGARRGNISYTFNQPSDGLLLTPAMAGRLRAESIATVTEFTNQTYGRQTIHRPHSLAGIDMVNALERLDLDNIASMQLIAVAGLRRYNRAVLTYNTLRGITSEARHMGVSSTASILGRIARRGMIQTVLEAEYGAEGYVLDAWLEYAKKGGQVDNIMFADDRMIPPDQNRELSGHGIDSYILRSAMGKAACHNWFTCDPVQSLAKVETIRHPQPTGDDSSRLQVAA